MAEEQPQPTEPVRDETKMLNPSGIPLSAFRDTEGKFVLYAEGGYPVYYLDNEGNILCPPCANKEDMSTQIEAGDIFYEGANTYCGDCGNWIESAYGDPEEQKRERRLIEQFPVMVVTRSALVLMGLDEDLALSLTQEQMTRISSAIAFRYKVADFNKFLQTATNEILDQDNMK